MEYDNPAARLLLLLQEAKEIPGNVNCREAWKTILRVGDDSPLLMFRLGKAMELPQTTIQAIKENFPSQEGAWKHWERQVNAGFMAQNLLGTWDSFINQIDAHSMNYLKMYSDLLQAKATTNSISAEKITEIREELVQLYADVMNSPVDKEVKKYLVRYLRKLITSLDEYRLTGALPILEAVETMLGHAYIEPEYRGFLRDTELGKRLFDTLGSMANVVTVAVGIPQLTQTITLLAG